jgi:DNA-binding beta-propeller fold protein YncE
MRNHGHRRKAARRGLGGAAAVTALLAPVLLAPVLLAPVLLAAACSGGQAAGPAAAVHPKAAGGANARAAGAPGTAMVLEAVPAPYQLPQPRSHGAVLAIGGGLLLAGGQARRDLTWMDPATGATRVTGRLAGPAGDVTGAVLGGHGYVFGGGAPGRTGTVQAVGPGADPAAAGALPAGHQDAVAVTAGHTAYLIGGGTDAAVLATTDGRHFRAAARLPVPVRYAAAVAGPGGLWVFGGLAATGATDVIQRIDPADGTAAVAGHLPRPLQGATAITLDGEIYLAGGATAGTVSPAVDRFDPATARVTPAGVLPVPVAYASGTVSGGTGYLVGGQDGRRPVPAVTVLRLVPAARAVPDTAAAPWLAPPAGPGHLAPGSDPSVLPGDVLIADHRNNRLLIVDPQGRIRWRFPRPGDLAPGQTFLVPDDAFFSADGRYIVATQEDDQVISVISLASDKITYRFGVPGVPGAGPGHLSNPDDAMLTPRGAIVAADIKNCRIVLITPPGHVVARVIGTTTQLCAHDPPRRFGSPNGAFPMTDGRYLVTEINGDWADEVSLRGAVAWSAHPPGVAYPSDSNEVSPGRYLTADYSDPGQVVEFDQSGRLLWRLGGLNQPSLAFPLPNGDVLFNDDFNHRVCVADQATGTIVWQYGHTGTAGSGPGYLNDPDGVDLVPPDSLVMTHAATMGEP